MRTIIEASSWFHLVNRASDAHPSPLATREAKQAFSHALDHVARTEPVELHAYCAMSTHYHALVRAEEHDARRAFAELDRRCGFDSPGPRLVRLALGRHLLQVTRYIHRNPCEAGLVARPADWVWSSYRAYLDPNDGPPWLCSSVVLGWMGIGARGKYREYVERIDINMSQSHAARQD